MQRQSAQFAVLRLFHCSNQLCNLRSAPGNSAIDSNNTSGLAARNRASVGNGPSTAIDRTPARRAISKSSAESPT